MTDPDLQAPVSPPAQPAIYFKATEYREPLVGEWFWPDGDMTPRPLQKHAGVDLSYHNSGRRWILDEVPQPKTSGETCSNPRPLGDPYAWMVPMLDSTEYEYKVFTDELDAMICADDQAIQAGGDWQIDHSWPVYPLQIRLDVSEVVTEAWLRARRFQSIGSGVFQRHLGLMYIQCIRRRDDWRLSVGSGDDFPTLLGLNPTCEQILHLEELLQQQPAKDTAD